MKKYLLFLPLVGLCLFFAGCACTNKTATDQPTNTTGTTNTSATKPTLVDCYATSATTPKKVTGFPSDLFSATLTDARSFGEKTNTRTFSLADYANEKANPIKDYTNPVETTTLTEDIFYEVNTPNTEPYSGKFTGRIQVCDKNNKTLQEAVTENPTVVPDYAVGFADNLHGMNSYSVLPSEPGEYRVDGLLYVDGTWTLTDRVNITLTK